MKKFIKPFVTILAIASMALASTAYAQTVTEINGSTSIPTLTTQVGTSYGGWSNSTSVSAGDKVAFQLHYFIGTTPSASDVTFFLENLTGRTFNDGDSETVSGRISSSNLSSSNGSVSLNFQDDVELTLHHVSWQEYPSCSNPGCESTLPGSRSNVLKSSGLNVGTITGGSGSDYAGNMIIELMAREVSVTPTYDDCTLNGVTVNHGDTHRFYSRTSADQCSAYDLVRTCNDGDLSGSDSFEYNSCTDNASDEEAEVDTESATNIDEDSATLNGEVEFNDVDGGDVYFEYGTSSSNLNKTTNDSSKSSDGDFSRGISGLDDDTKYYFRAVLDGDDGETYYGSIKNFTTDDEDGDNGSNNDEEPDVDTKSADNIDEDSATINAFIDINEADEVDFWFQYGTDKDLDTYSRTSKDDYTSNKSVDERLTGLDEDTKYYFRAVIEDQDTGELFYGNIMNFKTDESDEDNEVEAETKSADDIEDDGADMRGYADINDADEAKVYFRYGTSASNLPNKTSPKYIGDSGQITTEISGLQSCKTYYYQFVVEDEDSNDVDRGVVKSFTTKGNNCGNTTTPQTVDASTITRIASGVSTNSAVLRSFVSGDAAAVCNFQYGRTTSLGARTSSQGVNLDNTTACSSTLFGLAPNTTYYYRAVLVDNGQTYTGLTRSFRTLSNPVVTRPPVVTPTTPTTPTPVTTTVKVTVVEEVAATGEDLEITKFVSSRDDSRFSDETSADRDEAVFYKVIIRNNSTDVLTDVTVIDRIPFYLELDGERALNDDSEKELRWKIARLQPGESRDFVTEMRVRDDARYGSDIDSFASAYNDDFSLNSNTVVIEVEEDEEVVATVSSTQGASIFGAGFFPTTLVGWAGLLVIVLAMAYFVSRILFSRNENERVLAELRAMQQNK